MAAVSLEYALTEEEGSFKVTAHVPHDCTGDQLAVDVVDGINALEISVPGHSQLQVKLPCAVTGSDIKVKLSRKKGQLTITVPKAEVLPIDVEGADDTSPDQPDEAPATGTPIAEAGVSSQSMMDSIRSYSKVPAGDPSETRTTEEYVVPSRDGAAEDEDEDGSISPRSMAMLHMDDDETHPVDDAAGTSLYDLSDDDLDESPAPPFPTSVEASSLVPATPGTDTKHPSPDAQLRGLQIKRATSKAADEPENEPENVFHVCLVPPRVTSLKALNDSGKGKKKGKGSRAGGASGPVEEAAASLNAQGWAKMDNFAGMDLLQRVRAEIRQLEAQYTKGEIWVGKDAGVGAQISVGSVRGDKVLWVDRPALMNGPFAALRDLCRSIDKLVVHHLKPKCARLKRVNERSDPMLAIYPGGGARFRKHVDNTAEDGRVLTVLCYLNPTWDAKNGGALRLHPLDLHEGHGRGVHGREGAEAGPAHVDLCPAGGRLAMFYADQMPHEVMPCTAERHSVTLWYYDDQERARAEAAGTVPRADDAAQLAHVHSPVMAQDTRGQSDLEAKTFMQRLVTENLTPNEVASDVGAMSPAAVTTVAACVGASCTEDFLEAVNCLTPQSLRELRLSLIDMGI